jgi:uncharacterized protein YndB with AHSA1/START domain
MEGTLHEENGRYAVRFVRRLAHRQEEVWRAITQTHRLAEWFPQDVEFDGGPAAGGRVRFHWRDEDEPPFEGEILAFDPPRLFEYTWGDEVLRRELRPDGEEGCLLVFTDTMDDRARAARNASGWHACLDALGSLLGGRPEAQSPRERSTALREGYARSFG